ncbi:MAG: TetR/AcrR family transcriptional regulator [Treponema sp.]|jgi:AcrR family transcriptional regulator|nr:TetR/AcrR family transcriptional regulator [Treponema sp.]
MGITERKKREKEERRKLIMNCAKELILLKGVEGVSMGDIAQKAELSKATVYLYFPSKDGLFRAICENSANAFTEYIRPRLKPGISALEGLREIWRGYLELFGESEDMVIIFSMRRFLDPHDPLAFLDGQDGVSDDYTSVFFDLIKNLIDQGKEEGTFDQDIDAARVTRIILSLFSYIVETVSKVPRTLRKSPVIVDEMKAVFQIVFRGIAREGIDRSRLDLLEKV